MALEKMTVVILCGGESMRFRNEFQRTSKVMAPIGGKPLLWHIMHHYSQYGIINFILCVRDDDDDIGSFCSAVDSWNITVCKTGNHTTNGGRIKKVEDLISGDHFFATYGDGLSNVDILALYQYHLQHGKYATLTAVRPRSQYGLLEIDSLGLVSGFVEKPLLKEWVNGGFFVFQRSVFRYLDLELSLEHVLMCQLTPKNQLSAYCHNGFWKSVDTYKDYEELNALVMAQDEISDNLEM
jgi:glucose-1-phosphate cytidylyltransferase